MPIRNSFFSNIPPITKNLIIINFIIWLAEALFPSIDTIFNLYGGLYYFSSSFFNAAQLFTYMFLHANFLHILLNMFALFMFGSTLEYYLGQKRFLFYFISCGIGAALAQEGVNALLLMKYYNDINNVVPHSSEYYALAVQINALVNTPTIGASGAIYGVLLAFGMIFPNRPIYFMFIPIPIKAKYFVIGYGIIELFQGVSQTSDGIAHFAHLGGMVFGLLMILYWKHKGTINGTPY